MKVLSLFSGIGGFDIGLERAGMQTVAFCEFEPYCQAVLKRHWPGVPTYDDVRTLSADTLRRDGVWPIDVIAGGFPCQDLSYAGKRAGIEGERSGLWSEFARLIGEVRPRFAIMENVLGLLSAGHGRVLGDLAALGYDAVWDCIPASAVGAHHRRDRVWIVAHTSGAGDGQQHAHEKDRRDLQKPDDVVAHASSKRRGETGRDRPDQCAERTACGSQDVADADNPRLEGRQRGELHKCASKRVARARGASIPDAVRELPHGTRTGTEGHRRAQSANADRRRTEPRLGRVADGLPHWMDASAWLEEPQGVPRVAANIENRAARLKALGNSIVPQVAFLIGQAVMESTK